MYHFTTIEDADDYGPMYQEVCLACGEWIEFISPDEQKEFHEKHKDCIEEESG